jgi:protein AbiQ
LKLKFNRLSRSFVNKTKDLEEVLDDKGRGYSVTEIEYDGLMFAVPLRSNLRVTSDGKAQKIAGAPTSFVTDHFVDPDSRETFYRGLDYEKALLVNDRSTDLDQEYPLPNNNQKTVLNDNEHKITKEFCRYVKAYVRAHKNNLPQKGHFYRSTLKNYNKELGATFTQPQIIVKKKRKLDKPE